MIRKQITVMFLYFSFLEVLLSKDSALNLSDSEDDSAIKSTKIELQECHLRSVPVEEDGIPSQHSCGSIHVVFASIMASLGGVLFGYDIGRVGPLFAIRSRYASCRQLEFFIDFFDCYNG